MSKKVIAAGVFLVREDGNILICHPTNHAPDFWSIPKGKVDDGEELLAAAIRETFEETNINLSDYKVVKKLEAVNYSHKKKILHPYIIWECDNAHWEWSVFDIKCNSNVPEARGGFPEMDGYKWCSIEEARTLLHETQVKCLDSVEIYINCEEYNNE